jgi:hypothetical protein
MKILSFILLFLLSIISQLLTAQEAGFTTEITVLDTNLLTGNPITGQKLSFRDDVYYAGFDSINGYYFVNTIMKHKFGDNYTYGNLLYLDPDKQMTRWSKGINLERNGLVLSDKITLDISYNKTKCYSLNDGSEIWQCPGMPFFANFKTNLALTKYCIKKNCYDSIMNAINMETGKSLWTITLNTDYGIIEDTIINDSVLVIAVDGLTAVNIKSGKIWSYKANTGQNIRAKKSSILDPNEYLPSNFPGFFTQPKQKVISGISSNILYDSTYIYFASRSNLIKIEPLSGRALWDKPLLEYYTSNSTLINSDSLIFMINNGMAFTNDYDAINNIEIQGTLSYGKPYITAFSKATGEQKFFNMINEPEAYITDQKLRGDTLVILFRNGLSLYSAQNGKQLDSIRIGIENTEGLKYLAGDLDFLANGNTFISVKDQYPEHYFVKTMNNMLFIFDKDLRFKKFIAPNKRHIKQAENKDYLVIEKDPSESKQSEFFLLNSSNQLICKLKNARFADITNNELLVCRDHELIIIKLNDIK